jgi:hypothetical protein
MKISLLKHEEIDFEAYNHCIDSSPYGVIYAMSWYLDAVNPHWELLMAENYRYVMPLPVKQKWSVKYLMQPLFCQQLGVFSTHPLTPEIFKDFIATIPYFFYHIQLNSGNVFDAADAKTKNNFVLDLNRSYSDIQKNYRKNFVRNIKKAEKEHLRIEKATDWDTFRQLVKDNSGARPIRHLMDIFDNLIRHIRKNVTVEIWSARNEAQAILSSALFLRWQNTSYYLLPVSSPEGKERQSMSFLLDQYIQTYSDEKLVLDFEGSSIPNIARFYQNTGATNACYPVMVRPATVFKCLSFMKRIFR